MIRFPTDRPRWNAACLVAIFFVVLAAGCSDSSSSPTAPTAAGLSSAILEALDVTIDDEYHAETIYANVITDLDATIPFVNIVEAEERHSVSIARLYTNRGLPTPTNDWNSGNVPHFTSIREACAAGAQAEVQNIALYDTYLQLDLPADIQNVFTNNRRASAESHLPAFQACS
jgi:hypothetical protein